MASRECSLFGLFQGAVAGDLLIQAHLRPTPQQTLEQFRNIVSALQPVPFHLLRRLTATLRAYFREHEKTGGVQLQALGDMFAPLVMWMPIRDPMRVRPTNEQLGGVPPGHVLVQINIPPLGFTTRQPLPLNVTVSRLRAQMLTAAGATSMFGWHMWLAPPSPQLLDPSCTLRQYNVQNTDILVINNEDQCDKPVYFAAASSIIRCAIKNHPVFFPSASETLSPRSSAGAPPLQRRSSMAPTMNGGAAGGGGGVGGGGGASPFDTMPVNGGGAAPMLQRRSTVAAIGGGGEPVTTYMAPSLEIFKNDSTRLSSSPGSPAVGPGRPGPAKPPSLRNSTQQRTSVDLQLPPSTTAVPSPFVSSGDIAAPVPAPGVRREGSGGLGTPPASSMFAGGNPNSSPQQPQQQQFVGAGSPATGAMSPGLARRDLANRPRAQTPLVLDPVRALPPVASPAANKRGPAPGRKASPSKPIVRDAYQPLADARRRGTLLGASGSSDNADDADQNNDDDPTAETQYQDIPTKWAPEMAKEGGAALSPRSLPVMPAGVRRSEEALWLVENAPARRCRRGAKGGSG
jgi:hypothetical protein